MAHIWSASLDLIPQLMTDMACYFSTFDPSADKSDCYSRLVAAIIEADLVGTTAVASLNYECVLDVAACNAGLKVSYSGKAPPPENLLIWKLHGACNLLPTAKVFDMTIVGQHIYAGDMEAVDLPTVRNATRRGSPFPQ